MPPPTLTDSWLQSRKFGIVIDAGSSGSRLQIYSWKDARSVRLEAASPSDLHRLPIVEKGTIGLDDWQVKANPGISTLGSHPDKVAEYLEPLISHAKAQIPPSQHGSTPIFLLATAGMRLLPPAEQSSVLTAACDYISDHTKFQVDGNTYKKSAFQLSGTQGTSRCGRSIRIISGEEEGLFGWIAVNYLMNGFAVEHTDHSKPTTLGFLDMGGASTQIAFEPTLNGSKTGVEDTENLADVRLRLLNGEEIHHRVFVTTWLGFGTNQARERYINQSIADWEVKNNQHTTSSHHGIDHSARHAKYATSTSVEVHDPCLPKNLIINNKQHRTTEGVSTPGSHYTPVTLVGTGSFSQCLAQTTPLLNKSAPCSKTPCLFNGVHVPPIDFVHHRFIGISEYWYSSQHIFGLGGAFDFEKYEKAAEAFCGRDWQDILKEHEMNANPSTNPSTWHREVDESRLKLQCFKAAWIVNVLGKGVGIPRTSKAWKAVESAAADGGIKVDDVHVDEEKAEKLGLDEGEISNAIFQSVDTIKGTAVSWTLGKMVLEASKGIPPMSKTANPISDPMGPVLSPSEKPTGGRVLPFGLDGMDFGSIEQHFPSPLRRETLGFSPVMLLIYVIVLGVMACIVSKVRYHRLRSTFRKWRRGSIKRDTFMMSEDGLTSGSSGSDDTPPLTPISATFSNNSHTMLLSSASSPLSIFYRIGSSLRRMLPLPNPRTAAPHAQYAPIRPHFPVKSTASTSSARMKPTPTPLIFNQTLPTSTPEAHDQHFPTSSHSHSQSGSLSQLLQAPPITISNGSSSSFLTPNADDPMSSISRRSASPGPPHSPVPNGMNPNGLTALSLSRNSSQVNLTRGFTVPTPRTPSGFSTPNALLTGGVGMTTSGFRTPTTFNDYD
ncbi:Golgi apyrase [Tulasnella sp. JGI-2019a]|nr:Golgi apyrase [Tulasnella sp. JGI-2019a]